MEGRIFLGLLQRCGKLYDIVKLVLAYCAYSRTMLTVYT